MRRNNEGFHKRLLFPSRRQSKNLRTFKTHVFKERVHRIINRNVSPLHLPRKLTKIAIDTSPPCLSFP
uniref:Uncharacterized protein n=1 Tax=Anguilla anguilla TaxID=7936 RepID=A0A0E9W9H2_ANGAN